MSAFRVLCYLRLDLFSLLYFFSLRSLFTRHRMDQLFLQQNFVSMTGEKKGLIYLLALVLLLNSLSCESIYLSDAANLESSSTAQSTKSGVYSVRT